MSGLRLEIDLDKIGDNARRMVAFAAERGVTVTGVTKALLGHARLANVLVAAGVRGLGDSRVENIERMRHAHISAPMLLLRSPLPSQVDRVVRSNVTSVNSELDVLSALATAARLCGRVHDVMIMVELGDLRDGVMPSELHETVRHVLRLPTLRLSGIGANLACRHGVAPSDANMGELSDLVDAVETAFGIAIDTVSGGNSANLAWMAATPDIGRINDVRLGEAILLGRNPLDRRPIVGLHTDAITLVGEVIESQRKPTRPWGDLGQNAFGESADRSAAPPNGREIWQTIVGIGRQDADADDLPCASAVGVLGASSDHLVLQTDGRSVPGDEFRFEPGYSALLRAATSPFVRIDFLDDRAVRSPITVSSRHRPSTGPSVAGPIRSPNLTIVRRGRDGPADGQASPAVPLDVDPEGTLVPAHL